MVSESSSELKFDIGHVLFIDIVGYSKLLLAEQTDQMQTLREIVRGTEQFKKADAEGKLLRLPTGDGGALVFRNSLEAPVLCALEISKALKSHPEIRVRMGIHSGPVNEITDLNEQANIAGVGINMAQRVMDCGDAGHILLSKRVADDLEQYPQWRSHLSDLGECEVKHGTRVSVVNLYTEDAGNRVAPQKFVGQSSATVIPSAAPRGRFNLAITAGVLVAVLIAAGAILFFARQKINTFFSGRLSASPTQPIPEKSIAVLPFENLSDDKSNAYFAEGIQDEILTRLSKIAALKVISRTSTQKYKTAPDNLREVGQQLGVANLLEGSVQKARDAVHVNVQLIRAVTDEHLWAESYDRKLDDIFGVEKEVAQNIASALNAKLSGAEERVLAQKPTDNPAAYDAYLRGIAQYWQVSDESQKAANHSFEEAVRLDPQFALAWAALSQAHSRAFFSDDMTPTRRAAAERTLAEATRLQPNLPETQKARAYFQYWVVRDYKGALEMMQELRASWPNNAELLQAMGFISARLGQWKEALDDLTQSVALNPHEIYPRTMAISIAMAMRDFAKVTEMSDNALQIWPDNSAFLGYKAFAFQARGQLDEAQSVLNRLPAQPSELDRGGVALFYQSWLRRDPSIARKLFDSLARAPESNDPSDLLYLATWLDLAGRKSEANATFIRARDRFLTIVKEQPENPSAMGPLVVALAATGQRDDALKMLNRFDAACGDDARARGTAAELEARVFARLGDKDRSIANLERLLSAPSDAIYGPPVTPALLRLDPDFDPLRGDPRFEKLCQEK